MGNSRSEYKKEAKSMTTEVVNLVTKTTFDNLANLIVETVSNSFPIFIGKAY